MLATFFAVLSLVMAALVVLGLVAGSVDSGGDVFRLAVPTAHAVVFAALAWTHSRLRLEVDTAGLHVVTPFRRTTHPWDDITEIRPSIAQGKRTYLVLVRGGHEVVDLPVTEEHLADLRRWHAAATG